MEGKKKVLLLIFFVFLLHVPRLSSSSSPSFSFFLYIFPLLLHLTSSITYFSYCSDLSGIGDLMLTCYGALSRNRTVGLRLGRGESIAHILATSEEVVSCAYWSGGLSSVRSHSLSLLHSCSSSSSSSFSSSSSSSSSSFFSFLLFFFLFLLHHPPTLCCAAGGGGWATVHVGDP